MENQIMNTAIVETAECLRRDIKATAATLLLEKNARAALRLSGAGEGEVIANLTLAYRHLEDASMRLGKAIQAADGGVSVYDKAQVVGA